MTTLQVIALLILTLFYGCHFVKQISLRSKGIDSARLARGKKSSRVNAIEQRLFLVTIAVAVIQYGVVITENSFLAICYLMSPPFLFAGMVIALSGVVYFAMAVTVMRKNWRAGIDASQDTELVVTGIYRFSRNPAFVGFDLLYIGMVMMFPNWILILLSLSGIVLFHLQILNEEKYLGSRFGNKYSEYKRRTMRY